MSDIVEWINKPIDDSNASRVLWVNGPAGTGKTALAQSVAEICQRNGQLGASFFFPRTTGAQGSKMASKLVLTLAYQLAVSLPEVGQTIGELVAGNLSILDKSLEIQLQQLIVGPMSSAEKVMVVVIDGLDVCEEVIVQRQVMSLLAAGADDIPSLRFIVTSRNTAWMREGFASDSLHQKAYEICTDRTLPERKDMGVLLREGFTRVLTTLWRSNSIP
ncbi:hypothetical protein CVT25_002857 [Psilocybe cyanescens]|uniref:NACHT domain-containing protein n=1 Tax=Psilocybe cyanescens TaxID=93625 RepID=A0A409WKR7_PSICY|nr:hypothetical protein CVT25_002857 [Psilocybe cyanescens]